MESIAQRAALLCLLLLLLLSTAGAAAGVGEEESADRIDRSSLSEHRTNHDRSEDAGAVRLRRLASERCFC